MKKYEAVIQGMTCDACEIHVEKALGSIEVKIIDVDYKTGVAQFVSTESISFKDVELALSKTPYYLKSVHEENHIAQDSTSNKKDFDLIIIGSGSAAFSAAIKAKEYGKTVAIIERDTIGGTCVNVGCVPSKTMIRAGYINQFSKSHNFQGLNISSNEVNFEQLIDQKNHLVDQLRQKKYINLLDVYQIELIKGHARFINSSQISVNNNVYTADKYLIATGSKPVIPNIKGLDQVNYLTSTTLLELKKTPKSIVIIGSGYIALELGQMLKNLGSKVTFLRRSHYLLKEYDSEISIKMEEILKTDGIELINDISYDKVEKNQDLIQIHFTKNNEKTYLESEALLVAAGRTPSTEDLNLDLAGVKLGDTNEILINDVGVTSNENIYAAGDVTGGPMFVYVAAYQGGVVMDNAFGNVKKKIDLRYVPSVIFTTPSIASVGYTEHEANRLGYSTVSRTIDLEMVPRALVNHDTRGLFKIVVDQATNKIIGVHILAEDAGEIIYSATLAIKFGLTIQDLKDTMVPYLTMSEGLKLAILSLEKDVSHLSCCAV